jgi:hypothetical protein
MSAKLTVPEILQMAVDYHRLPSDKFEDKYYMRIEAPELVGKTIIPGWVQTAERALKEEKDG